MAKVFAVDVADLLIPIEAIRKKQAQQLLKGLAKTWTRSSSADWDRLEDLCLKLRDLAKIDTELYEYVLNQRFSTPCDRPSRSADRQGRGDTRSLRPGHDGDGEGTSWTSPPSRQCQANVGRQ